MEEDKAYYLKNQELAVLLSIKGMSELYGIKMEDIGSPDKTLVYQTLFGLEKKQILSADWNEKGERAIHPEINDMLDHIRNAEKILLYSGRTYEHSGQCIYLGSRAVLLSVRGEGGGMKRMQSIPLDLLSKKICEYGFFLKEIISDKSLFRDAEIERPEIREMADSVFGKAANEWETWEEIRKCLRMVSVRSGKCIRQYLLVRGRMNDYFIVTDEAASHVYAYSERKVMEVLKRDL